MQSIVVPARFNGPATSGNGGWVSGRLAALLEPGPDEAVRVVLRSPPPLDVPLQVQAGADGGRSLWSGEAAVASVNRVLSPFGAAPPDPVPWTVARVAAGAYAGAVDHPFPTCFVCGPLREPGDGLRLAPGRLDGRPADTAAAWVPDASLSEASQSDALLSGALPSDASPSGGSPSDASASGALPSDASPSGGSASGASPSCAVLSGGGPGVVDRAICWAALDCPGGWSLDLAGRPMVLGTMTAQVRELPRIGRRYVIVGRALGYQGRKAFTETAMYDADAVSGDSAPFARTSTADPAASSSAAVSADRSSAVPLARATAVWLRVDPATVRPA